MEQGIHEGALLQSLTHRKKTTLRTNNNCVHYCSEDGCCCCQWWFAFFLIAWLHKNAFKQYSVISMSLLSTQLFLQFWLSYYHVVLWNNIILTEDSWVTRDLLTSLKPETVPEWLLPTQQPSLPKNLTLILGWDSLLPNHSLLPHHHPPVVAGRLGN